MSKLHYVAVSPRSEWVMSPVSRSSCTDVPNSDNVEMTKLKSRRFNFPYFDATHFVLRRKEFLIVNSFFVHSNILYSGPQEISFNMMFPTKYFELSE